MTALCSFCGTHVEPRGGSCAKCGASWQPVRVDNRCAAERGVPFYCDGYWVWPQNQVWRDEMRCDIYSGRDWVAAIEVSHRVWRDNVPEGTDGTDFIIKLIRAALGEVVEFVSPRGEAGRILCHSIQVKCEACA